MLSVGNNVCRSAFQSLCAVFISWLLLADSDTHSISLHANVTVQAGQVVVVALKRLDGRRKLRGVLGTDRDATARNALQVCIAVVCSLYYAFISADPITFHQFIVLVSNLGNSNGIDDCVCRSRFCPRMVLICRRPSQRSHHPGKCLTYSAGVSMQRIYPRTGRS